MYDIDLGPDLREQYPEDMHKRGDFSVLRHVLSLIGITGQRGVALEFGVATGETLALMARRMHAIGFDSFEGLPEDWRPEFKAGHFDGVMPSSPIPNSTLVTGWFADTLPNYPWPKHIALVHIDCDLYSSTKTALDHIAYEVEDGTYIVFDEIFGYEGSEEHEEKAFREWIDGLRI